MDKFKTVELLKRAIITEWQKVSQRFNEWCRGLESVVKNDCGHVEHCNLPCYGTVDNHGNTEITETMIFVKGRECRDFAKMSCFCRAFCQNAVVLRFHKNILFLISII